MGFKQDTETAPKDKKERVSWVFGCKGTLELTQYVVAFSSAFVFDLNPCNISRMVCFGDYKLLSQGDNKFWFGFGGLQ